jgi:uncharacterized membrane protein YedE/YeeE
MGFLTEPWPWYVAGPLIGLTVPLVYLYGGRKWGISSTFRDFCAAIAPRRPEYFRYDWRERGGWRLAMAVGLVLGGALATLAGSPDVAISAATRADLTALHISDFSGVVPSELFSWRSLLTLPGAVVILVGGFLVGFGTRYADGCTSGHSISGLATLRVTSLVATVAFFVGGLLSTHVLLPMLLGGAP